MIPLVDLQAAHAEVAEEVDAGFKRVLATTGFVGGPEVAAFEREFAEFSGAAHVVGVANGTDAVELALRAAGVGPGDEVVVPANTFVGTAEPVARIGAHVVLADIDPATYLVDVDRMLAAVGPKTKAVVPVHLYGQLADAPRLREALAGTGVAVVEDAAQAQGALRHGRAAGADGIAATSFYPGKNLGAYGDAGAVLTPDQDQAITVRTLGSHGGLQKYVHDLVGVNSRLDALQAVVLRAKLARLGTWNRLRRAAAARYHELLADLDLVLPQTLAGNEHVWHLYVVRIPGGPARRDAVLAKLHEAGVGAGIHYPYPLHLTPAFADEKYPVGSFPLAEQAAGQILSLPLYPQITVDQQETTARALAKALEN
ncbi:DegT/DnrJ/EryC1/StrS aminotransferase family protein [Actinoplanes sp. L3-i22]|uniref:DegT/DnrJ/EryC1/StrS family aminotransferase n=1 Tax=Actinoplanes sp. L3-i22 TaxID=2836373 RepID=UPI001C7837F0|nr:DegT/DnrJ/EryC1/StrS family aminotransferase [Actinoplanes sp. L3-i22]BCY11868.1 glutamine--scyllo-inositol aminotransferase [Actinoplanes sp. L3-i22]